MFLSSPFSVVLIKGYIDELKSYLIDVDENKRILPRSTRQYLETKVVVAHDSQRFHGSDTTRFVNTVMNMVKFSLTICGRVVSHVSEYLNKVFTLRCRLE